MVDTQTVGSGDRLSFTFFIAAAFHALVIFGVTFSIDRGTKIAPTLNITLANHKSVKPPEKADFLAQNNQLASGTEQEVKELTIKELAELQDVQIREVSDIPQQKASVTKTAETRIITTTDAQRKVEQQTKTEDEDETSQEREGKEIDAPIVNPEFASLRAKLDQLKQELAKQPRIRRLTSVSTKASYDAQYLNEWAQKIEIVVNKNFPEAAIRDEIFGNLRMSVMILPNGAVENIEILQSSGHVILDEAAMQIVRLSAPFNPFPKEIRQNADKLEIIRTWRFEITGLKTSR